MMSAKNPSAPTYIVEVNLDNIHVGKRLRKLNQAKVNEIAESIKNGLLLQPIGLRRNNNGRGYLLMIGAHRVAAKKKLGHKTISAVVHRQVVSDDQARIYEIDENLIRAELTDAERAQHTAKRKALWEKLHPETKQGGAPGKAGGGKKARTGAASFVSDTAKKTGKSARKVARDAARGKKVEVIGEIIGTSLDKGTELDALATLPVEEQRALAGRAVAGERVSAVADVERAAEAVEVEAPARQVIAEDVIGALVVLIKRMTELGEGWFLSEFLAALPQFDEQWQLDALDLIDLIKHLSDFTASWKAHTRRQPVITQSILEESRHDRNPCE
jgi:ParB family transcriptional regulator, chromosome partitioning protein